MYYRYGDHELGRNIAMPPCVLPILIVRFKLMACLNAAARQISQQGSVSIQCRGGTYDLLVATEQTDAGERLTLWLQPRTEAPN